MAKVAFSKLKLKIDDSVKEVKLTDDITIEVKQYLPIQEKLALIGRVIEWAHEMDANYSNPVKVGILRDLEMVFCYTNLTFTDKQKEDIPKLYDIMFSTGLMTEIISAIPEIEYNSLAKGINDSIEAIYKYQNSILGLLDIIKQDYSNIQLDIDALNKNITDPELLNFIKGMLSNVN